MYIGEESNISIYILFGLFHLRIFGQKMLIFFIVLYEWFTIIIFLSTVVQKRNIVLQT